jgi:hypothetical protein
MSHFSRRASACACDKVPSVSARANPRFIFSITYKWYCTSSNELPSGKRLSREVTSCLTGLHVCLQKSVVLKIDAAMIEHSHQLNNRLVSLQVLAHFGEE